MICSKCGEYIIGTVIEKQNGEKWCHGCATPSKVAKTKDKRVLLIRKLSKLYPNTPSTTALASVYLEYDGKIAFTNRVILVSEMGFTPNAAKCINIKTLQKDSVTFPDIEPVLRRVTDDGTEVTIADGIEVTIPEEFYRYVQIMLKGLGRKILKVLVKPDCLFMEDTDSGAVLNYREGFSSELKDVVAFNARYLVALKPKNMIIRSNDAASIIQSYDPTVDAFKYVLIMPMRVD